MRLDEIQRLGDKHFSGTFSDLNSLTKKHNADYSKLNDTFLYSILKDRIQIIDAETEEIAAVMTFIEYSKIPKTVQEKKVIVSKNFRGQGLGQALYGILINKNMKIVADNQHTSGTRALWNKFSKMYKMSGLIDLEKLKMFEFAQSLKDKKDVKEFENAYEAEGIKDKVRDNIQFIKPFISKANGTVKGNFAYFPVKSGQKEIENDIFKVYNSIDTGTTLIIQK